MTKPIAKYIQTEKFAPKFLVWQAIGSCGLKSTLYITRKTLILDLFMEECSRKLLLAFIKKHVPKILWPDLATIHYSKKSLEWYEQNGVELIPKEANPPNVLSRELLANYKRNLIEKQEISFR